MQAILNEAKPYQNITHQAQSIEVQCILEDIDILITGQVQHYYAGQGLLHISPSRLKGSNLLACWLEHLLLCMANILQPNECSKLICGDKKTPVQSVVFPYFDKQKAQQYLAIYLQAYGQGIEQPLAIFPNASWAFVANGKESFSEAMKAWEGDSYRGIAGDQDDASIKFITRSLQLAGVETPEFAIWAKAFYEPIMQYRSQT